MRFKNKYIMNYNMDYEDFDIIIEDDDDFNLDELNERYLIPGVDYEIIGELTDVELKNVIDCFAKSSVVKRKYKRLLL